MYSKLLLFTFLSVVFCFSTIYPTKKDKKKVGASTSLVKIKAILNIPDCRKIRTKPEELILHPENSTDSFENQTQDLIKQIDEKQKLITGTIDVTLFCPNSNKHQIEKIKETFKAMQTKDKTQATLTLKDIDGEQDSSAQYKIAAQLIVSCEKSKSSDANNIESFKKSKRSVKKSKL